MAEGSNYHNDYKPIIDEQFTKNFQQYLLEQTTFEQPLLEIQNKFTQIQLEQNIYKLQELLNKLDSLLWGQEPLLNQYQHIYDLQKPLDDQQRFLQELFNAQQQLLKQLSDGPQQP